MSQEDKIIIMIIISSQHQYVYSWHVYSADCIAFHDVYLINTRHIE